MNRGASRLRRERRRALLAGCAGFLAALAMPLVLWHRPIALIASEFRLDPNYLLTGWTAYGLIAAGLVFFIPVVASIGMAPSSRWYPRGRNAYIAWGLSLYTLGVMLAVQVAQITSGFGAN